LPESALDRLGLTEEVDEEPEERARKIILSLTRLTGSEIPLVFCFDQVEALQSHPQDLAGLYKFGQMIGFLRDETRNAVLISCILSTFLTTLNQAIISSDRDRLAVFGERSLAPLTPAEAKSLVQARLNAVDELRRLRLTNQDRFWPLRESDVDEALRLKKDTPRALLSFCAEKFEAAWRPESFADQSPLADFMARNLDERLKRAAVVASAERTDQIITHGLPLLMRLIDPSWELKATSRLRDLDIVFECTRGRVNISLCNHRNMTSLAGRLRRLLEQIKEQVLEEPAREKYILLRDVRLPIGAYARKTREHREQLLAQGFHWLGVSAETIAAIDALRSLLSDAKAGDLGNGGANVSPIAVLDWLASNLDSRLPSLRELLDALLPDFGASPGPNPGDEDFDLCEDLGELLNNHYLVSVEDAAFRLDRAAAEIETCARRHPERFGLLDGPPAVMFQLTLK
jgi:hypothetical protein